MITFTDPQIRMIPVDRIIVLNPRLRGKNKFKQIVESILKLGLKKPIIVAENDAQNGAGEYLLVYGQGRLESFVRLGQREIPGIVIKGSREDFLLMSLAENFARRKTAALDLVREIGSLKERGYSSTQIAKKINFAESYVRGILHLLQHGEERLLQAVMSEKMPISVAIIISRADDKLVQQALTEAYEKNELRGTKLLHTRRVIEARRLHGKQIRRGHRATENTGLSPNALVRAYEQETTRQKLMIQRAKITETRLLFAVTALRHLLDDEHFVDLLRAESLDTLPQFLAVKLNGKPSEP
jgi:ParB family chromosome partitioning protein